ncbi:MAG: hypothetical protein K0B81_00350 [Candidatus Cloacimonetes bacterium]|nr:hypothetical protein [Candidatus Cloacimonadota bacterium]
MWKAWFNVFLGLWLFLHGIPGISIPAGRNAVIVIGCAYFVLGIWSLKWPGIVIALIGAWTAISAYYDFMQTGLNFIIVGLLVSILALIHMSIS